jgi:hypothetical protein
MPVEPARKRSGETMTPTLTPEQIAELERQAREVLTHDGATWELSPSALLSLIQAAKDRDELVAFIREHGRTLNSWIAPDADAEPEHIAAADELAKMIERFGGR